MQSASSSFAHEFIDKTNVCKCTASHDIIITSTGAVRVELSWGESGNKQYNYETTSIFKSDVIQKIEFSMAYTM